MWQRAKAAQASIFHGLAPALPLSFLAEGVPLKRMPFLELEEPEYPNDNPKD